MRRLKLIWLFLSGTCLILSVFGDETPPVVWYPASVGGGFEVGQLMNTTYENGSQNFDKHVMNRLGVGISYHAVTRKNFDIQVGVGGLFWYSFPPDGAGNWWEVRTRFGPGISKAQGRYTFGNPETSTTWLQMGFFPVKYNPEAANLGEYLFRSWVYPGVLRTGGWNIIGSAAYMAQGFLFHSEHLDGVLKHDLVLFMENELWPIYELSPGYLVSLSQSLLEIGAGISLHHFIPMKPSYQRTRKPTNHYMEYTYFPATINNDSLITPSGTVGMTEFDFLNTGVVDTVSGRNPLRDTIHVSVTDRNQFVYPDDPAYQADPGGYESIENHKSDYYYTPRGIKLMGRLTLDFGEIVGADLKLFTEAALLGVKNYDVFYEDPMERLPVMFGMNIPTFGLLDVLTAQGEYYNSPWRNSMETVYGDYTAVPARASYDSLFVEQDNVHWSIYAKKTLVPGMSLHCQVASDHLRLIKASYAYTNDPLTAKASEWYYMFKLNFGI